MTETGIKTLDINITETPDGRTLFFSVRRVENDRDALETFRLRRTESGWGEPASLTEAYGLRASGSVLKVPGWRAVYGATTELAGEEPSPSDRTDDDSLPVPRRNVHCSADKRRRSWPAWLA